MKYSYVALLLIGFLSVRCASESSDKGLPVINVIGNLGTFRQIPMSELISELEYIPLETSPEFLADGFADVLITDTRIFVYRGFLKYSYAFTREGKFISDVGREGRGPGEFTNIYAVSVDEKNRLIYLDTPQNLLEYSWDGVFMHEIEIPILGNEIGYEALRPEKNVFLRDSIFLGHLNNRTGHEPRNWVIFDDKGTTVKAFENHIRIKKDVFSSYEFASSIPSMVSGNVYLKEIYNDTIYRLEHPLELIPTFVFDLGQYTFPVDEYYSSTRVLDRFSKSVGISSDMLVSQDQIFFSTMIGVDTGIPIPPFYEMGFKADATPQLGLYYISEGKAEFLDNDPVTRKRGLVNDIDGGLSFWPRYYNKSENELVDVWDAYEMKELLTEDYFAAHTAKDPAAHERLRALLNNLDEGDNPVIVIAKLK